MTLIEFPGNRGQIFAVDPHHVTAVQAYRSTLSGRGGQLFDMTTVWLDNRSIFACSWSVDHVLQVLNAARQPLARAFEAGYTEGICADRMTADLPSAFNAWLKAGAK